VGGRDWKNLISKIRQTLNRVQGDSHKNHAKIKIFTLSSAPYGAKKIL
jgi:hypothetical protein